MYHEYDFPCPRCKEKEIEIVELQFSADAHMRVLLLCPCCEALAVEISLTEVFAYVMAMETCQVGKAGEC